MRFAPGSWATCPRGRLPARMEFELVANQPVWLRSGARPVEGDPLPRCGHESGEQGPAEVGCNRLPVVLPLSAQEMGATRRSSEKLLSPSRAIALGSGHLRGAQPKRNVLRDSPLVSPAHALQDVLRAGTRWRRGFGCAA